MTGHERPGSHPADIRKRLVGGMGDVDQHPPLLAGCDQVGAHLGEPAAAAEHRGRQRIQELTVFRHDRCGRVEEVIHHRRVRRRVAARIAREHAD